MKSAPEMLLFIATLAAATMLTRFLPFWLPARFTENRFVRTAKRSLPAVILLLLIVYSLKDTAFLDRPWGLPELSSLALVLGLQLWKRNALLSIAVGTGVFMLWANGVFRF